MKVTFLENEKKSGKKKEEESPAVALVPQKAVRQDSNSKFVFVLKGETVERRAVKTGAVRGSDIEILAGIPPDVMVVVNGPATLSDGQSVQIQK